MGTKIEYVKTTHVNNYINTSKKMGIIYIIFSICYAIITCVAFATTEWIGDTDSDNAGYLGLWQICQNDLPETCQRKWENIILNVFPLPFQIATIFVGLSVVASILTILLFMLMLFLKPTTVFHMCGWIQSISALCLTVGCVSFPFGWNSDVFRKICGPEAGIFELGLCEMLWAYPLAIIGCVDGFILATLAFILATRSIKILQPESIYQSSVYKGEINNAFGGDYGSRKSLNLQPILLVSPPEGDTMSRTSNNNRLNHHIQQFQL